MFYFCGRRKVKDKPELTSQRHAAISGRVLWLGVRFVLGVFHLHHHWWISIEQVYEILCPLCSKEVLLASLCTRYNERLQQSVGMKESPMESLFSSVMWNWTSFSGWKCEMCLGAVTGLGERGASLLPKYRCSPGNDSFPLQAWSEQI